MLEHHRRQPSLPIINGKGRPASLVVVAAGPSNQQLWPFLPGFKNRSKKHLPKSSLHVHTVGSNEPRHITVTMPPVAIMPVVSSPFVEHNKLLMELCSSSYFSPPVHHRGSLHWFPDGVTDIMGGAGDIIVLDTGAELFRRVRSPTQLCSGRKLFNMEGALAVWACSTPGFITIDVWVMQDYEDEIWAFKYRIDVSTVGGGITATLFNFFQKKKEKENTT
uniref:Uncharacterized protein n=1 Tax=Avena sativa TaxID=4498 RepID=A0ACD5ZCR1_AVESA